MTNEQKIRAEIISLEAEMEDAIMWAEAVEEYPDTIEDDRSVWTAIYNQQAYIDSLYDLIDSLHELNGEEV